MPRGFLVKRNKKPPRVSYRDRVPPDALPPRPSASAAVPGRTFKPVQFGNPEAVCHALYSPARPVSREHARRFSLTSAVSAASLPTPAALCAQVRPGAPRIGTGLPGPAATGTGKRPSGAAEGKRRPAPKKTKALRKLHYEDAVTTSPVLGLRIKAAAADQKPAEEHALIGQLVCQLCREAYGDPLALAQHRCSRIVRVEYRCPECDKVFGCPANLASHRRWHTPRVRAPDGRDSSDRDTPSPAPGPAPGPAPYPAPSAPGPEDGSCDCALCGKRYKRQAYLRKHVSSRPCEARDQVTSPAACHRCSSAESQERHVRVSRPAQAYACTCCPALQHSSPGLTRHINKRPPSENRQVVLLHDVIGRTEVTL